MSATLPESRPDPYAAWRSRNYRLYAGAWFLMTFAKLVETAMVGVYIVFTLKQGPAAMGWLGLVQALPVILLAIPGGQIADHRDRRLVLAVMLTLTSSVSFGLLVACAAKAPAMSIYLLLFVGAIGQALGSPSRAALLPQIVPAESFSNAVTWSTSIFRIASMVGPAAGGLMLWLLPEEQAVPAALAGVVLCRLLALGAMLLLPGRAPQVSEPSITLETLAAGVRFVWNQKLILATITLDLFAVLLGGATYLLPVFAKEVFCDAPSVVGYFLAAEAAGAIVMAMLMTHLPPFRRAGRAMLWAVAGFGAATIVFGLSTSFWLSLAMMFLIGAFDNISVVVRHTLVHMLTPDAMRGRVSAVNNVFIVASNDLGGLESGLTAEWFGLVPSVVGGGIGTLLVVLAAAWKWPQILAIGSLKDIRPALAVEAEERAEEETSARG
jgi:MFS family permease